MPFSNFFQSERPFCAPCCRVSRGKCYHFSASLCRERSKEVIHLLWMGRLPSLNVVTLRGRGEVRISTLLLKVCLLSPGNLPLTTIPNSQATLWEYLGTTLWVLWPWWRYFTSAAASSVLSLLKPLIPLCTATFWRIMHHFCLHLVFLAS